jgi:hypothetical protein
VLPDGLESFAHLVLNTRFNAADATIARAPATKTRSPAIAERLDKNQNAMRMRREMVDSAQ